MKKGRPGTSTRKPPEPAESHAILDEWMGTVMPELQPTVRRLDELIRATIPDLHYALKWKKAYYGLSEPGWIIEMVAYDVSVNVVFLGGADFDDPPPQGSGSSRYVKVRSLEEADTPQMRAWIEQAARTPGWK